MSFSKDNETKLYEWLDSSPFEWFADEDESGETITVQFVINND